MRRTNDRNKCHLLRPPLPQLFHSNIAVSEEECNIILRATNHVRAEITQLTKLELIEGSYEATYRHRLACEEFISMHEKLLHWIRRLPTEILIHIFLFCTEGNTVIPWNVSQTSQRWRLVALAVPRLWRKVPTRHFGHGRPGREFLRFLREDYLKRSGQETLIFSLMNRGDEAGHYIYNILLEHAERWGDVGLCFDSTQDFYLRTDLARLGGRLHSMYSLNLVLRRPWWLPDESLKVFKEAPRLRYLHIDGRNCHSYGNFNPQSVQPDWLWHQVTHFYDTYKSYGFFGCRTLCEFKNLVYMDLTVCKGLTNDVGEQSLNFRACKYLRLRLNQNSLQEGSAAINHLDFPVLEHLQMTYLMGFKIGEQAVTDFAEFTKRHAAHLQSLHWEYKSPAAINREGKDATLARIFCHGLPQLKILRITDPNTLTLNEILSSLVTKRDLLPYLQQLDCRLHPDLGRANLPNICEELNALVRINEGREGKATVVGGRLDEIRLEISNCSWAVSAPQPLVQRDLISELEGWVKALQEGREKQMQLEYQLAEMRVWKEALQQMFDAPQNSPVQDMEGLLFSGLECEVTDVLVLHVRAGQSLWVPRVLTTVTH